MTIVQTLGGIFPTASLTSRYRFIDAGVEPRPIQVLYRLLTVSSAGYYQWRQRPNRPAAAWQVPA